MNMLRLHGLAALLLGALWSTCALAVPHDVVLILDNSGSMRKHDPALIAKSAATDFLQTLPADINIAVVLFDQTARLVAPLTPATDDAKSKLKASIDGLNYRGLFTDGPGAIERAIYELKTNAREGAARTIIFVSDGIVDTGDPAKDLERAKWLREQLAAEAATHKIRILPIAFTENADLLIIQSMAASTGGDYVRAPMPNDLAAAYAATFKRLLEGATTAAPVPPTPPAPTTPPETVAPEAVAPAPAANAAPEPVAPVTTPPPAPEPEPAPAEPVAQAEPAPSGAANLSSEEMAALEQLAKDTGVPVEQLLSELESAPSGEAVVVHPADAPVAAGEVFNSTTLLLIGGGLAVMVGAVVWFIMGRKRQGTQSDGARTPAIKAASAPSSEAFLIDLHGLTGEPARRITDKPVMVGRTAGTDPEYLDYFVVNKATVGRRHAIIKFKDRAFWVIDQGSVNGTFVNNEKVLGERQLRHGDRIKFHKFEFEFSYPDRADPGKTVVGIVGDQTIVASHDSTMSATSAALRGMPNLGTAVGVTAAAAASSDTGAWLNEDVLKNVPGATPASEPADVTREGDLESLESDREAFFKNSGSQPAFLAPPERASGDDTFDDEAFALLREQAAPKDEYEDEEDLGVEINLDAIGEQDNTKLIHKDAAPAVSADFDAEASAFFDNNTVGPPADLDILRGPDLADEPDDDFLDVTKVPGVDDNDPTANYVPPDTVMGARRLGESTGGKPSMDTGAFGELTTIARDSAPFVEGEVNDDFMETGAFTVPTKPVPAKADKASLSVDEFISTGMFDESQLTNEDATVLPSAVADDVFDVTGSSDAIPQQGTVVLPNSPLKKPR
jgi:von Willebrand factor type A domain/FHA domain